MKKKNMVDLLTLISFGLLAVSRYVDKLIEDRQKQELKEEIKAEILRELNN